MIDEGRRLAQAAAGFVGVRFRLHGRTPRTGLDCIGLVCASLAAIGRVADPPKGYRLRNVSTGHWLSHARSSGFEAVRDDPEAGDILLTSPGAGQNHLVIVETPMTIIHAHAGLGRVVRQPLDCCPVPDAHWRITPNPKEM